MFIVPFIISCAVKDRKKQMPVKIMIKKDYIYFAMAPTSV